MKISTSPKRADVSSSESFALSFRQILASCKKAGFQVLDLNLAQYTRTHSPLVESGWEDWLKELNEITIDSGLEWSQGHAHFVNWEQEDLNSWEFHDELVRRSIVGAGMMGVKTLVVHPKTYPDAAWYSRKSSLNANLESFKRYGEWAAPYDLTIAVENLSEKRVGRRFGTGPEELLELVELLNDPLFAICWDTGHAHISGINQVEALHMIGPHLKAVHISDNHGAEDEHLMPLAGTIQWEPLIRALREVEYSGDFTFEVIYRSQGEPYRLYDLFVETLYELGSHLLELA